MEAFPFCMSKFADILIPLVDGLLTSTFLDAFLSAERAMSGCLVVKARSVFLGFRGVGQFRLERDFKLCRATACTIEPLCISCFHGFPLVDCLWPAGCILDHILLSRFTATNAAMSVRTKYVFLADELLQGRLSRMFPGFTLEEYPWIDGAVFPGRSC